MTGVTVQLYAMLYVPLTEAEIDLITDETFKQQWVLAYLQTHPKYAGQEISASLLSKWIDGLNKSFYVSCCHWVYFIE